jgi:hypothetical protein
MPDRPTKLPDHRLQPHPHRPVSIVRVGGPRTEPATSRAHSRSFFSSPIRPPCGALSVGFAVGNSRVGATQALRPRSSAASGLSPHGFMGTSRPHLVVRRGFVAAGGRRASGWGGRDERRGRRKYALSGQGRCPRLRPVRRHRPIGPRGRVGPMLWSRPHGGGQPR